MRTIIRKAEEKDLEVIQKLNHQLFLEELPRDSVLNIDWPLQEEGRYYFLDKIIRQVCFVAEKNGEVVGYAAGSKLKITSERPVERAELENILVDKKHRGKGIGERLVKKFILWSKKQGAERIKVSAYVKNKEAIKFYEQIGFEPLGLNLELTV